MRKLFSLLKLTGGRLQFAVLILLRCPFDTAFHLAVTILIQDGFIAVQQNSETGITHICIWFGIATILLFLYNGTVWMWYAIFATHLEGRLRKRAVSYTHLH